MAENFKTIGQLIRYLTDEMKNNHLSPNDTVATNSYLIFQCTHLYRLSSKEADMLRKSKYNYCTSSTEVKEELLYDYCVLKLEEYSLSRSINSYKNYILNK